MNKFTKMLSLARQKSVLILVVTALVLLLVAIIVSLVYRIPSMLPILLIFVMAVVILSEPDYRHRLLASIYIVVNSILDVAKYTFLFWPMAISLTYLLLEDICRLSTRDAKGCMILENNNIRLIVGINFLIAFSISIFFAYTYSKHFKRLMKVLSLGGKLLFLILVAPLVLLSAVFMNDLIRGDRGLFELISLLCYLVLLTFLHFVLLVTISLAMAAESRHCRR